MSTYGISGTGGPLPDLDDDPEVLAQEFFISVWNDLTAGIDAADIDFGYEPGDTGSTKRYTVKFEENFTDIAHPDMPDKYSQYDIVMDCRITEKTGTIYKTSQHAAASGRGGGRFKLRKYVERVIHQNNRTGMPAQRIKHLYLVGSRNTPEPERTDFHSAVVTFIMRLWKVSTI